MRDINIKVFRGYLAILLIVFYISNINSLPEAYQLSKLLGGLCYLIAIIAFAFRDIKFYQKMLELADV